MTTLEEVRTYRIPVQNYGVLTAKLDKLNRKAKRLGKSPIVLKQVGTEDKTLEDGKSVQRYNLVQIEGDTVCVDGYQFVATIQFVSEVGNLIRAVPGQHLPEKYRTADNWCDHCKQNRFRNENFIVKNIETGEYKQVGRNCLRDFLGGEDPHDVANYAELLADLADECAAFEDDELLGGSGGGGSKYFILETYLAFVAKCVDEDGWLSRSKKRDEGIDRMATADAAFNDMFPHPKYHPTEPNERHIETAKAALVWVEENLHPKAEKNDYEHNMTVVTKAEAIDYRMIGIAASLIPMYKRETAPKVVSSHIGQVGVQIQFVAKVTGIMPFESDFGTTYLHKFTTEEGNAVTSYAKTRLADEGDTVEIKAKVKKHSEFRGTKQTEVYYTKVLRTIEG